MSLKPAHEARFFVGAEMSKCLDGICSRHRLPLFEYESKIITSTNDHDALVKEEILRVKTHLELMLTHGKYPPTLLAPCVMTIKLPWSRAHERLPLES